MVCFNIIQHIDREGPGLFAHVAGEYGIEFKTYRPDLGDVLPSSKQTQGLIILGGPMGIADLLNPKFSWLNEELKLLKACLEDHKPILGICLGAQLLAFASGGCITKLIDGETSQLLAELGWSRIFLTHDGQEDPSLKNLPVNLNVLHWHQDRIILPPSATLLASSMRCEEQMFRLCNNVYGIQFHIELDHTDFDRWINEDADFIHNARGANAKDQLIKENDEFMVKSYPYRLQMVHGLLQRLMS